LESFRRLAELFPETTLLVDTYDTIAGVRTVVDLAKSMKSAFKVQAIRLDSGDLLELSRQSRRLLDEGGLQHVQIFASGGLNEWSIEGLVCAGAPIDAFGVGTDMMVSTDAAALDIAYKLTEYGGIGRMKLSANKITLPGRKQACRHIRDGTAVGDVIGRSYEDLGGRLLLEPVMTGGRRISARKSLATIMNETRTLICQLPPSLRALERAARPYPIQISSDLADYETQTRRRLTASS